MGLLRWTLRGGVGSFVHSIWLKNPFMCYTFITLRQHFIAAPVWCPWTVFVVWCPTIFMYHSENDSFQRLILGLLLLLLFPRWRGRYGEYKRLGCTYTHPLWGQRRIVQTERCYWFDKDFIGQVFLKMDEWYSILIYFLVTYYELNYSYLLCISCCFCCVVVSHLKSSSFYGYHGLLIASVLSVTFKHYCYKMFFLLEVNKSKCSDSRRHK